MIVVDELVRVSSLCPTQWEGKTSTGRPVYIRYRWGELTAQYWDTNEEIYRKQTGDSLDGCMGDEEMIGHLGDYFTFLRIL